MEDSEVKKYITNHPAWGGALPEKRRSPWRYNEEALKYDNKPIDKEHLKTIWLLGFNVLVVLK